MTSEIVAWLIVAGAKARYDVSVASAVGRGGYDEELASNYDGSVENCDGSGQPRLRVTAGGGGAGRRLTACGCRAVRASGAATGRD